MKNKYGLSRNIPTDVKREIRRRSKFGCVICRCAIAQYEHIDPEFNEAKEHNADHMCLLCGHCHDKVTRGVLSKQTVQEKYVYVQQSNSVTPPGDSFDLNSNEIQVVLGSCRFIGTKTLIQMDDKIVLAIEPPEDGAKFPTLTGFFSDSNGNEIFRIDRNIWYGTSTAWDIEVKGRVIYVRIADGHLALKLKVDPPKQITVEELDMRLGSSHLILREDLLAVGRLHPDAEYYVGLEHLECHGAQVAVLVDTKNPLVPEFQGLKLVGGEGLMLEGTGIRVAVGAVTMLIGGIQIEEANRQRTVIRNVPFTPESGLQQYISVLPPRI